MKFYIINKTSVYCAIVLLMLMFHQEVKSQTVQYTNEQLQEARKNLPKEVASLPDSVLISRLRTSMNDTSGIKTNGNLKKRYVTGDKVNQNNRTDTIKRDELSFLSVNLS